MKKTLITIASVAALGLAATNASALPIALDQNSDEFVGYVVPGIPPTATDQQAYINYLITLAPGTTDTTCTTNCLNQDYERSDNPLGYPNMPSAGSVLDDQDTDTAPTLVLTQSAYIIGKYDATNAGSMVWLVAPGTYTLPQNFDGGSQYGISNYAVFSTSVPDGGTTLSLLGFGILGVSWLRRRMT